MKRIHLSAAGFYKTPDIHWNRQTGQGNPFYYFAYGAAVSEVSIDTLTGEYHVDRTDLLHDVGQVAEPGHRYRPGGRRVRPGHGLADDRGTVVGRQGPAAHPCALDLQDPAGIRPAAIFNTKLVSWSEQPERTIRRSKAVGEPPFMLPISVLEALGMAVASIADYQVSPRLDAPATPERVLMAVERLKAMAADGAPSSSES
jgi:xanthine dehydrogenase large subunit